MSDPTADAYRLAADYLDGLGHPGYTPAQQLRKEAARLDERHDISREIGEKLMTEAAHGCGALKLGVLALGLVSNHYRLEPLPLDEPADPDPS